MRTIILLVFMFACHTLVVAQQTTPPQNNPPQNRRRPAFNTTDPMMHDPVMAKEGNTYYIFSTGMGIQTLSSTDLKNWKMEPPVFKQHPAWINNELPDFRGHIWAPDIIYHGGKYHIFYSCSAFGKNTSAIGHAVRSTLNPKDTLNPWIDKGLLIASHPMKDNWNAIDPNVIVDKKNVPWMTYGSFWDGIQLVKLSKDMSKTIGVPRTIARRNHAAAENLSASAGRNAIEAPFVFQHGDYYYLFVSWDYCCRGSSSTYKVAVGRSKSVEGPYFDRNGKDMADGGGTVILYNNDVYNASGHNSAYHFDGKDYFVGHGYSRREYGASKLVLREMTWDAEGWPIVSLNTPTLSDVTKPQLTIDLNRQGAPVNPGMHGIFFEEINHSGDGALYAELLQNRNFEEHVLPSGTYYKNGFAHAPHALNYGKQTFSDWKIAWNPDSLKFVGWKVEGKVDYDVVDNLPLHPATPNSMKLVIGSKNAKLINSGYWGVPVKAGDKYKLRFYVYAEKYKGNINARIVSSSGQLLSDKIFKVGENGKWTEYTAELTATGTDPKSEFQLVFDKAGTVYVDYVSLFPEKTFKGRENGLREDVAQALADLQPGFVRWPGGCIVEGATLENRFKWKNTIGDPMTRQSEWILWNYHCSWGFGYHEFLQFCEDIGAAAMLVNNVGLSCEVRNGDYVMDEDSLDYYIQDMDDAIEYAIGDATTVWGAKRVAAGHPEPFNLKYVEIGNEQIGPIYAAIYKKFYTALKKKYPDIVFISTLGFDAENIALSGKIDMIDPHWYNSPQFFYANTDLFDTKDRGRYDVYVGEYACNRNVGAGNMEGALSEAAFISGMERNGDLVKMASYAPLIENVNRRDWPTNLIWVSNDQTLGRSSYYVQQMYATNLPTHNVSTSLKMPLGESLNKGRIGFSGYNLNEKLRNLKVSENGAVSYRDDLKAMNPVTPQPAAGGRRQMALPLYMVKDKSFNNGTIEFEVCPSLTNEDASAGANDFRNRMRGSTSLIFGADEAGKNYYQINMDINRKNISVSQVIDGVSVNLSNNACSFEYEKGKWYNVRIELADGDCVACFIDYDKVLETKVKPFSKLHAIAGYDENAGETIIKVINGGAQACSLHISLNCNSVSATGKVITLKGDSALDENSLDNPRKITPVISEFSGFAKEFNYTFAPYSFTILRVKSK